MKKVILSTLLIVSTALLYTGCSKDDDDTTAPVITLKGDNPDYVVAVDEDFTTTDLGATASDDQDGDISSKITVDYSEYQQNVAGEYEVHYEVSDKAGNAADMHRTLYVTHTGDQLVGSYQANDTTASGLTQLDYTATFSSSPSDDFKVNTMNFSDGLFGASNVYFTMQANRITIPSQKPNGSASTITISGEGTIKVVNGKYVLTLTYKTVDTAGGGSTTNYRSTMSSN